jgi:hypothetical protein
MSLNVISLEDQLAVIEQVIVRLGRNERATDNVKALKAVAKEIRARLDLPRSTALADLERALTAIARSKTALGYDRDRMAGAAQVIVRHWPFIKQALESFGGESAE